jgi:hypothetical protein
MRPKCRQRAAIRSRTSLAEQRADKPHQCTTPSTSKQSSSSSSKTVQGQPARPEVCTVQIRLHVPAQVLTLRRLAIACLVLHAVPSSLLTPCKDHPSQANVDCPAHWETGAARAQLTLRARRHSAILLLTYTTTTTSISSSHCPRYAPATTYLRYLCPYSAALESPSLPRAHRPAARRPLLPLLEKLLLLLPSSHWLLQLHYDSSRANSSSIQLLAPIAPSLSALTHTNIAGPVCLRLCQECAASFCPSHNQRARPLSGPFRIHADTALL